MKIWNENLAILITVHVKKIKNVLPDSPKSCFDKDLKRQFPSPRTRSRFRFSAAKNVSMSTVFFGTGGAFMAASGTFTTMPGQGSRFLLRTPF